MPDDKSSKPPGDRSTDRKVLREDPPGQLTDDDRGNRTWQWSDDDALQADDTAGAHERLRALVDPRLGVVEDRSGPTTKDPEKGYNPYNKDTLAFAAGKARKKKKNLRELSKWIEVKRKLERGNQSEE